MQFSSIADYRELIDNSTEESRQELIKYVGENFRFVSLSQHLKSQVLQSRKNEEVESMTDDFITHLLNEHGMIRIGEYYFRVDLENEVVYVSESEGDVLQTLTGEAEDNVMVFSTSDDVLPLLEAGYTGSPEGSEGGRSAGIFCGGGCGGFDHKFTYYIRGTGPDYIEPRSRYVKAGIYFEFSHHCYTYYLISPGYLQANLVPLTTYTRKYVRNCGSVSHEESKVNYPMPLKEVKSLNMGVEYNYKQIFHAGTEGLKKYYLVATYTVPGYDPNRPGPTMNCRY